MARVARHGLSRWKQRIDDGIRFFEVLRDRSIITRAPVFIDADGVDLAERPVLQTPGDNMFDRVENLVPGGTKGLRRLFP